MEKSCLNRRAAVGAGALKTIALPFAFFCSIALGVADTEDRCNAQSKLPRSLSHIAFEGGGGEGCASAISIKQAKSTAEGIAAEKVWMGACYPSARIKTKAISHSGDTIYEVIEIGLEDGTTKRICFDITGFFGSW